MLERRALARVAPPGFCEGELKALPDATCSCRANNRSLAAASLVAMLVAIAGSEMRTMPALAFSCGARTLPGVR
jgi:hypothetical protein